MQKSQRAILVVIGAVGINLILGIIYIWSVISKELIREYHWSSTETALPYMLSMTMLAVVSVFGGRIADTLSPRVSTVIGGTLLGGGLFFSSYATTAGMMTITYGLLVGSGIGFSLSATTVTAMKWFPPAKKGLISGICYAGAGLAALYISPLVNFLIASFGIVETFRFTGIGAFIIIMIFTVFLKKPEAPAPLQQSHQNIALSVDTAADVEWRDMLKTPAFYQLWFMFAFAAAAALVIIGNIAIIAVKQAQWEGGFLLVMLLALFNAAGRFFTGAISDRIGIQNTLRIIFLLQAVNLALFNYYDTVILLAIGTAVGGYCYGGLVTVFPAATADKFGFKNLGMNFGLVNTAYGLAGIIGPIMAGRIVDLTGSYHFAYLGAAALLLLATGVTFGLKGKENSEPVAG